MAAVGEPTASPSGVTMDTENVKPSEFLLVDAREGIQPHSVARRRWIQDVIDWTGLSSNEASQLAHDRAAWRLRVHYVADPSSKDSTGLDNLLSNVESPACMYTVHYAVLQAIHVVYGLR